MKLELKHLVPYLPYKLKILNHWDEEGLLTSLFVNGEFDSCMIKNENDDDECHIWECKPILRPLSGIEDDEINTPEYLQSCCYSYVQYLLEQHYDIFGLIENNLAIDINTIK